jgi:hypothetical protein
MTSQGGTNENFRASGPHPGGTFSPPFLVICYLRYLRRRHGAQEWPKFKVLPGQEPLITYQSTGRNRAFLDFKNKPDLVRLICAPLLFSHAPRTPRTSVWRLASMEPHYDIGPKAGAALMGAGLSLLIILALILIGVWFVT